ncbi:MAG: hypothetical protein NC412_02005 [Roseburia sp.]|nr:hypothetical protein [Roseburia sp.]MCM1278014.1 hypothetical protein [Robinsoniella sp.]
MKLKYYLRGLGTGIVVTALVLGISLSHGKGRVSDEEIKKRAKELGMVEGFESLEEASKEKDIKKAEEEENGVSSNKVTEGQTASEEQNAAETDQAKADIGKLDEKEDSKPDSEKSGFGSSIKKEESPEVDQAEKADNQPKDQKQQQTETPKNDSKEEQEETSVAEGKKSIILEVRSGDGSLSVARRAVEAGLVTDAAEFDRFLCQGGYDKRICTGKHQIPEGASMEEIAKLLIRKP